MEKYHDDSKVDDINGEHYLVLLYHITKSASSFRHGLPESRLQESVKAYRPWHWMPALVTLWGIPAGMTVLSKSDKVELELVHQSREEICAVMKLVRRKIEKMAHFVENNTKLGGFGGIWGALGKVAPGAAKRSLEGL